MSEHERITKTASPHREHEPEGEEGWRRLYAAAYPPLDPLVEPSPALQQRVAEALAWADDPVAPRAWRPLAHFQWGAAAGALAAAVFLVFLGFLAARWGHGRAMGTRADTVARRLRLEPLPDRRRPALPPVPGDHDRSIAARHPAPTGGPDNPGLVISPTPSKSPDRTVPGREGHGGGKPPHRHVPAPPEDDTAYLRGDPRVAARWWAPLAPAEANRLEARLRRWVRVRDDFVRIPLPQLAAASNHAVVAAVEQYRREAAVVDTRLFRKVTLQLKGASLEELCAALQAQTIVPLHAARGVSDEKVTALLKERPAREVMRAVARLFGYQWARSGADGDYQYELAQDLKSQLVEEELRNRDQDAALLALDQEMAAYQPYLGYSPEQLTTLAAQSSGAEKERLSRVQGARWGALQLYRRLTVAERASLASGQALRFTGDSTRPDRLLPLSWRKPILDAYGQEFGGITVSGEQVTVGGRGGISPADYGGANPLITLKINRSELGQLSLQGTAGYELTNEKHEGDRPFCATTQVLAVGRSPSVAKPDNASANHALRAEPLFQRVVTLHPKPSCPQLAREAARGHGETLPGAASREPDAAEPPHVTTADVWEEIHRRTDLPIIADSYTHLYPLDAVTIQHAPLFDALCRVGDGLGVRWRKDGDFLLCRGSSFFWDKLKEVPNRLLRRWQQDRLQHEGLPFEDLLEMATLSDQQLDSAVVGKAIQHCWGLEEWDILSRRRVELGEFGDQGLIRPYARFLAGLLPAPRDRALRPVGLSVADLSPAQQQEFVRVNLESLPEGEGSLPPGTIQALLGSHVRVDYAPAGWYVWYPQVDQTQMTEIMKLPLVADRTAAGALAAARRFYPLADGSDIRRSPGVLAFTGTTGDGHLFREGMPPIFSAGP